MARLLNATGYFSSILAAVCLCLAVLAAPIGEARADDLNAIDINVRPIGCFLTACPNNRPPCFTAVAGDLFCVNGPVVNLACPCFPGVIIPRCFCI